MDEKKYAVLSLSGGLDSSTLLLHLLVLGYDVTALSFDYGQKHRVELDRAEQLVMYLNKETTLVGRTFNYETINHHVIKINGLAELLDSTLVQGGEAVPEGHYKQENMKDTVVPNRNKIFSSIIQAVALSISKKFDKNVIVAFGIHAGDHCIPSNEFITTKQGKKTMFELEIGDEVLSFNKESQEVSFQKVINKINNGFRNDIIRVITKGGRSLSTTANHKYYKVNRHTFHQHTGWEKDVVEEKAENLLPGDWIITPCTDKNLLERDISVEAMDLLPYCDMNHSQIHFNDKYIWFKETNKVKRYVDSDSFIKLLAWFISEGNRGSSKRQYNSNTYRTGIPQSVVENPENYEEIWNVINDWGFNISVCDNARDPNNKTCYFSGPTTKVFELCGNNSFEKKIPEEFLLLHPELLLNTLIKGDGSVMEVDYHYTFTTASSILKEQVSFLSTLLGYSVGCNVNDQGIFNIFLRKNLRKNMNKIGDVKIIQVKSIEKEKEQEVWDITIDNNHNFFAGLGSGLLVSNSIYPDCRKDFVDVDFAAFRIGNWDTESVLPYTPYLDDDKYSILKDGRFCCDKLGLDFNEVYKRTNTSYKPVKIYVDYYDYPDEKLVLQTTGLNMGKFYKWFSDYKSASSVERIEAFIKLEMPDPVAYADQSGPVSWEVAKAHVEKVLNNA